MTSFYEVAGTDAMPERQGVSVGATVIVPAKGGLGILIFAPGREAVCSEAKAMACELTGEDAELYNRLKAKYTQPDGAGMPLVSPYQIEHGSSVWQCGSGILQINHCLRGPPQDPNAPGAAGWQPPLTSTAQGKGNWVSQRTLDLDLQGLPKALHT
jgi:hypothetical protein